jgi:hypothetical protein
MPFHRFRFLNDDHHEPATAQPSVRRTRVVDPNTQGEPLLAYVGTVYKMKEGAAGVLRPNNGMGDRASISQVKVCFQHDYVADTAEEYDCDAGEGWEWESLTVHLYYDDDEQQPNQGHFVMAYGVRAQYDPSGLVEMDRHEIPRQRIGP